MNRLIQGDVGSGKTILAFLALLLNAANGYQGALMAPTEVLAKQHFLTICDLTQKYHLLFKAILLTGSMSAKEKREAYKKIETGEVNVIIGTHALIQEKVIYHNLGLVITDEQHRFGVRQRESLSEKGTKVHVLVMSATPIPRSLALIMYGDLDISSVDELPANRMPIKNCVVTKEFRVKSYEFILQQIKEGRQVYIICAKVGDNATIEDESELDDGIENVIDYTESLKNYFSDEVRIRYLHGKMKAKEKNDIMEQFTNHDIDILVSTTVIEVGINVPNATVMLIENAERFGLAQLHQLRGRVGRGSAQSYCIFINNKPNAHTSERLEILNHSNDGFYIANEDLRLRGPGDLFGIMQSGDLRFKLGDIYTDAKLLITISNFLREMEENDLWTQTEEGTKFINYLLENCNKVDFPSI